MSLLVTGSLGIDTVETPHGTAPDVLGGSAVYFAVAASHFTDVRLVGVVGEDFPDSFRSLMEASRIDLAGLEVRKGSKTFRWSGKYSDDMNDRDTLDVQLNVLEEKGPTVPTAFADSDMLFLANTHPALQREMRSQVKNPRLTVCDTMDLWIDSARDELLATLKVVDGLIINDGEARELTGEGNNISAAKALLHMGPKFAVVKKGEHGAILVTEHGISVIPAFPTMEVVDPTGAGDSFAGGMLGYLCTQSEIDDATLKRALIRGTVTASITIEDFSLTRIKDTSRDEIEKRVQAFSQMLRID
ncbi:MAG: sugar kinase [Planctomycetes bacterium]|nr:sugar kinase [Planctomycetota bacterium]